MDGLLSRVSRPKDRTSNSPAALDLNFLLAAVYQPYLEALRTAQDELEALCLSLIAPGRDLRYVAEPPLAITSSAWRTELDWKCPESQQNVVWPPALPLSADRLRAIEIRALPTDKPEIDAGRLARCARAESLVAFAAAVLNRPPILVDVSVGDEVIDHAFEIMPRIVHKEWIAVADQAILDALRHRLPELRGSEDVDDALASGPDILLAGSGISRTSDWLGVLRRLARSARWMILEMRTFSGTPTTLTTCRDVGAATARPYWIVNHVDFLSALESEALTIAREIVLPDPVRIPDIPELADHRLLLLSSTVREGRR
jgi:hypothetical protein